jgi:MFS transporter, NNP family, nitrate/nitrite transporter
LDSPHRGLPAARSSLTALWAAAILLGVAGASFAVALPLASAWYPAEYQGLAMGIAGAGNSGTLAATLFAPRLAQSFGWQNAMGLAVLPLLPVIGAFFLLAREAPCSRTRISWTEYRALLRQADTAWFCLLYSIAFGGFVGLASFLTVFFHEQYAMSSVQAGDVTTMVVLCGSFLRPVGGWLAHRFGGYRVLMGVLMCACAALFLASTLPAWPVALALLALVMGMLGMGNGAVFQLVPQRFAGSVGIVTGVVGAAGGLGGFFLPSALGVLKDSTGNYGTGLAAFAGYALIGCTALVLPGPRWLREWPSILTARAGLFSWRGGEAATEDAGA